MAIAKITGAQRDFSAGEFDVEMKRADDDPVMKTGARQMLNWRILNSRTIKQRPGRTALFNESGPRVEPILMKPGQQFYIVFGNFYISVYNAAGARVFNSTLLADGVTQVPWSKTNAGLVSYAQRQLSIYIFYPQGAPANVPQILSWDGVSQTSTWTLATYTETIAAGGQKRTFFQRISPPNIVMLPSATTGAINITFSAPVLVAGMIGTRMRYGQRQILITGVSDSQHGTAQVVEPLPPSQTLTLSGQTGIINIGDEVIGAISGAAGIVLSTPNQQTVTFTSFTGGALSVGSAVTGTPSTATGTIVAISYATLPRTATIALTTSTLFGGTDTVSDGSGDSITLATATGANLVVQLEVAGDGANIAVFGVEGISGPSGHASVSAVATGAPGAVSLWDDEVMNTFRGYPSFVFYDQSRLGMCNFPVLPSAIGWSAIGLPTDLYIGALPAEAILNLAPGNVQVQYVIAGMEASEFVFCDTAIFYIPITPAIPLVPGNVSFNELASHGSLAGVQPRRAEQSIVYIKAGGGAVGAVQAPGAYYRPYVIDSLSEVHSHLFTASPPLAIAIPSAATQFDETYIYVLLASGTLAVGRYSMKQGLIEPGQDGRPRVGWSPWNSNGTTQWIAALQDQVVFFTQYPQGVAVAERLDATQYLDGAVSVANIPAAFSPPGGKGPLYNWRNTSVTLMDQGWRMMGIYQVDNNGNIVPQFRGGENLTSATLVAGQAWTSFFEPFVPDAQPGNSVHQRMFKRRVSRMAVYVSNSTGFVMASLFAGPITPTSVPLGTIVRQRRIPAWNQGDNPTLAPPLREEAQRYRPRGRDFDPRKAIIKDTPGPLTIHECGFEVTI